MKQPEKWKETIDPFSIKFNQFKLIDVLGFPHARNDVFYCRGEFMGEEVYCFIKYASTKETDLIREVENIIHLKDKLNFLPEIIEYDKLGKYIVTREIEGDRLSYILLENKNEKSFDFMFEYGATLAQIHSMRVQCGAVNHRKFFDIPEREYFINNEILFVYDYLVKNKPKTINQSFCHGDFHYANILWRDKKLVGALDWELSGIGNKEFDIAWSIINRPSQKFLKTQKEVREFLRGYKSVCEFNYEYVRYYMILIYSHFIVVDKTNTGYKKFVLKVLNKYIKNTRS